MHIFLRYANSFNSFYLFITKFVQLGTQIKTQCKKEENIQKYAMSYETSYRPGGGETICPPPMAARLASDLRPSADGSAVRKSLVSGGGYSLGLGQLRA